MDHRIQIANLSFVWAVITDQKKPVRALLDGGSQVNLIHIKNVKNRHLIQHSKLLLKSASGHGMEINGSIILQIRVGTLTMAIPFLVVSKFPYDMLLSNQAMQQYAALINYADKTCTFTDR